MFSSLIQLVAREDPNQGCTQATCSPSQSIYGYRPSLAATVICLVIFALSGICHMVQGIKSRTWFFSIAMAIGCLSELIGYIAKLMLWNDPFSQNGFMLSVILLTFAPAFFSAGIYYTLKHICLTFGSSFSRLRPSWYTWIFISCDVFSIALQGAGGGISSASDNDSVLQIGTNIAIAGLVLQVVTMIVFGLFAADYALAIRRNRHQLNSETAVLRNSMRFKLFLGALWIAYFAILIRCSYRVAELAKGWGPQNNILREQGAFIGLDSVPCAIAALILNVWHPGWCFPKSTQNAVAEKAVSMDDSSDEEFKIGFEQQPQQPQPSRQGPLGWE